MDADYWNLFWMTGMPQAWLLSHGRSEAAPQAGQEEQRDSPGPVLQEGWDGPRAPY